MGNHPNRNKKFYAVNPHNKWLAFDEIHIFTSKKARDEWVDAMNEKRFDRPRAYAETAFDAKCALRLRAEDPRGVDWSHYTIEH